MSTLIFVVVLAVALGFLAHAPIGASRCFEGRRRWRASTASRAHQRRAQYVFGQKKFVVGEQPLPSDKPAGWMHFFIFWGFTILGVQVVHMFARGFIPGLSPARPVGCTCWAARICC